MITLPSHTSHVLQPLNVSYFKPFKTTLRKVKNVVMSKSNHMEPNEITLVGWVNQTISQFLTKKNINVGFKATCIWPFNPKAMDNKLRPSEIYTATNITDHGSDQEEYTSNEEIDRNQSQQWREESIVAKFLHMAKTLVHQTTPKDHPTNILKFD
jgi:hypothetical protein